MPCAIVLGCPPYVAFMGPQKLPIDVDELTVAGGLAGAPINVVKCKTVDLLVPGRGGNRDRGLDRHRISSSPKRRSAKSHGHVALEEFNMPMRVTAITHRKKPIDPVLHQPGGAVRIERHQARRLRAAVPRAPARRARHQGRQARVAARAADGPSARHGGRRREGHAAHRSLARALRRGVLQGRLRQDLRRGERGHRSRQCRRDPVGDGVSRESGRGRAGGRASRPGPRPQARARSARRIRPC